jgi:hypothetical protein
MLKKIAFILSFVCLLNNFSKAQNDAICKAATDSMNAQFKRGEFGCYLQSKTNTNLYNYIKINKDVYKKTMVRMSSINKDTSKIAAKKILNEYYQDKADKTQPLDTSNEYKKCYNKAFQPKLDSIFKCDFFRKADSILRVYDKQGKGYGNVEFPGGPSALQKFLNKNVVLPKEAKPSDSDKMIRVYYSFYVDTKGDISEINLMKSNCKECESIVLEAIHKLPPFLPATDAGKPKKVKYIFPYTKTFTKPKE